MKTIYTTLPIYNRIEKQLYYRSQKTGQDKPSPISCPRHRLPSFQWNAESDDMGAVTEIILIDNAAVETDITTYFVTLPATTVLTSDTYYSYNGDTLNYLLDDGIYYLKITTDNGFVLYSEWFKVDCIFENLVTEWTYNDYDTFVDSGTAITSAINTGGIDTAQTNNYSCIENEEIRVVFFLTLNSGELPIVYFGDGVGGGYSDTQNAVEGLNEIVFTAGSATSTYRNYLYNENAANWAVTEFYVIRTFSEKHLIIDFSNTCDIGDIIYQDGLMQTAWLKSEPMEMAFPQEEQGANDGNGRFVRSYARQVKKYIVRTPQMPDYMVEVFNRMKLHDTVEITNLIGDTNDVYNLEVDHEWLYDDKYYAQINLTFDHNEAFVIVGCCNNVT